MTTQTFEITKIILNRLEVSTRTIHADFQLHRLFRYPGGDFKPAPPEWRNGRLDPPKARSHEYGVLYSSSSVMVAAIECRVILLEPTNPPTYAVSEFAEVGLPPYQWTTLRAKRPVQFIDLTDSETAAAFGIDTISTLDHLGPWREASAQIFDALGTDLTQGDVVGVCYQSRHDVSEINYALMEGRYEGVFESQLNGLFDPVAIEGLKKVRE